MLIYLATVVPFRINQLVINTVHKPRNRTAQELVAGPFWLLLLPDGTTPIT